VIRDGVIPGHITAAKGKHSNGSATNSSTPTVMLFLRIATISG